MPEEAEIVKRIFRSYYSGASVRKIKESLEADKVTARILEEREAENELPSKLYLFQGLPKNDKMEWIIQKTVELGVYEVIPVYSRKPFRIDEHLKRLQATLDGIKLANPLPLAEWKSVVLKLIETVNHKYGNTIVMVTHNDAIKDMADRVVKLRDGMIRRNYQNEQKIPAADLEW